jgi:hypothetical protein
MATFSKWAALSVVLLACSLTACLESKPKEHGKQKLNFSAIDTANSETFTFNFAYQETGSTNVYLQATANSNSVMLATCNSAGTNCACDFFDSTSTQLGASVTASYDLVGNFYTCAYGGAAGDLTGGSVILHKQNNTKSSSAISIVNTLTPQQLIGSDLDANKVRTVYRYGCKYNFLEKIGTSTSSTNFSCADSLNLCGTGDLCFMEIIMPFNVYSDNYSNNVDKKISDAIYNGGGSNLLCGTQMKQFDCTAAAVGAGNEQTKVFGLYGDQTGNFQVPVVLTPGPNLPNETFGFAAKVGTTGNCPPGMVKRDFYHASMPAIADTTIPAMVISEIDTVSHVPDTVVVSERGGGDCNNAGVCTLPNDVVSVPQVVAPAPSYTIQNTPFCVIDPTILP